MFTPITDEDWYESSDGKLSLRKKLSFLKERFMMPSEAMDCSCIQTRRVASSPPVMTMCPLALCFRQLTAPTDTDATSLMELLSGVWIFMLHGAGRCGWDQIEMRRLCV